MKAFYALLQPQESDRVDNEWAEQEEQERKLSTEKREEKAEEEWVPDSTRLASLRLDLPCLSSTRLNCKQMPRTKESTLNTISHTL